MITLDTLLSPTFHEQLCWGFLVANLVVFPVLLNMTANYGRFSVDGRSLLSTRTAWVLMEIPSFLLFIACAVAHIVAEDGADLRHTPSQVLGVLWLFHYGNRSLVYPLRMRTSSNRSTLPLYIVVFGMLFNVTNGFLNGRDLFGLGRGRALRLSDPTFVAGVGIFVLGAYINMSSDAILRSLRRPDADTKSDGAKSHYKIPYGGLYSLISCPNYLGEMLEWGGWALATQSPAGLAFFVGTLANLFPRALSTHRWYHEKFGERYPPERRAILPFLI